MTSAQAPPSKPDADVLIAGAGPTGLVLALWLTRLGVHVRIIDKLTEPATTSRALGVQARTLELYQQIDLAEAVVDKGRRAAGIALWVAGEQVARAAFGDIGEGLSPYPYVLIFPQDEHERLLLDRLREVGVEVERGTELLDFVETDGHVLARAKRADGTVETQRVAYVAGCDGAHSAVREALSIGFSGGTYAHLFYVADVEATGAAMNGDVQVAVDRSDFLAVFPLKGPQRARLVGTIQDDAAQDGEPSWSDVSKRVIEWMRLDVTRVHWFSTYRVHHRVATRFRSGRGFLLGDAAHVHSPVGAQGMNTGIGDAVNLAWKLAGVLHERLDPAALDTYETERIAFAQRLVATTDQVFTGVTSSSTLARALRLHVVPFLMPSLFAVRAIRRFMFRTVSQTSVNYRGSWLSQGQAGTIQGGDRLPWIRTGIGNADDNFAPLGALEWQLHVYGDAPSPLPLVCAQRNVPLHVFAWRPEMDRSGLKRDAAYLVRPDGYVALASDHDTAAQVTAFLDVHKILLPSR